MDAMAVAMTPVTATGGYATASLYVGDLEENVNEAQLHEVFGQVGPVVSVRVCRDQTRLSSLGYAYVNFATHQDAANAMELLNFVSFNGKPIRIMFSHRDPSIRKSGYANVFIKNLDSSIDNKALHDTFAAFGTVLSCKVAVDNNGQSKGHGFVQFENEEAAQSAINKLNGMLINGKQVYVGIFVRRQERMRSNGLPKFTNVFVKNLSESTTKEDLEKVFGPYGTIDSAVIMKDKQGKSKCFGFLNFKEPDSAVAAAEALNGTTFDDKVWYVGRAQKKAEREVELKAKFEQERIKRYEKLQAANLYLKNLDDTIDDEKLKELFSEFGSITSCKIMHDQQGRSKGSGFVAFSTPEEASAALKEMNGKQIGGKPLYVAVAQRREERKARLQAHFAQFQAAGGLATLPSGYAGYPGGPRLGPQQLYFGQVTAGMMSPQLGGFGFQQQLLPAVRPGGPNFMMQYQLPRQGQPPNRLGMRRGGNHQHQLHQQQGGWRYSSNARNGIQSVMPQGLTAPIIPLSAEASAMPITTIDAQPQGISTLASALASADPEKRIEMLGNHLYPLVERIEPEHAGKVTGMLLEMDQTEVLHLIEAPEALNQKVAEAMQVLRDTAGF